MNFMRKYWYYIGSGLFAALAVILIVTWNQTSVPQRILLISFMALLVHQFEEYAWPGGFPAVMNTAWMPKETGKADRYPLNKQTALFVNVMFAYPYYVVPILFPELIWMGLGQVMFGMAQIVIHGIVINRKMRSIYNPGLFAVVFLHVPIGAYYIWYVTANGLVRGWMWPLSIAWIVAGAAVGVALPVTSWFADKNSPNPFSQNEMSRFRVTEKMEELKKGSVRRA
jgi:hypothetical protein